MKLQKKLTLLASLVVLVIGALLGTWTIYNNYLNQISKIDQRLNANSAILEKSTTNRLSTALVLGNQEDIPTTVTYVSNATDFAVLVESPFRLSVAPEMNKVKAALSNPIDDLTSQDGRTRAVSLGDGEYVLFSASTEEITRERNSNLKWLLLSLLVCCGFGAVLINLLIRTDVRKIELLAQQATLISQGELDREVSGGEGNSEVDELARAFQNMVKSLTHAIEQERESNRSLQSFLSDASHELRTPLTAIIGYSEILSATIQDPSEQQVRALQRIFSESKRMDTLITNLLTLAKLGELPKMDLEVINFSDLVEEFVTDLKSFQPERQVSTQIQEDVSCIGEPTLMRTLISNVFSNIQRHTSPKDSLRITLLSGPEWLLLQVEDSGPGLPSKYYATQKIRPFQRFDSSRSRQTGGSGLGLSIMDAIVNSHQGKISLSRSSMGGHKTEIQLPIKPELTVE